MAGTHAVCVGIELCLEDRDVSRANRTDQVHRNHLSREAVRKRTCKAVQVNQGVRHALHDVLDATTGGEVGLA